MSDQDPAVNREDDSVVLEPSMSGPLTEEAPAPDASKTEVSESMWAAVRDRGRVLTGEEVDLPGETTDTDDIVGEPSPVDTGQIEPVTRGPQATTIPPMTGEIPVVVPQDPTPTPRDVLAHRSEAEAPLEGAPRDLPAAAREPALDSALDSTTVQRRSLITPPAPEPESEPEAAWVPRADSESADTALFAGATVVDDTPRSLDDSIFEGATLVAEMPSRAGAHWASLLGHILLIPVAWYLIADAGARFTLADGSVLENGRFSALGLGELLGGFILLFLLLLTSRKSSLGAWVSGILVTLAGIPWLAVPSLAASTALPVLRALDSWNAFGANLVHHFQASAYSGRLLLMGIVLMGIGLLTHSVRRQGRAEEALRAEVAKVNPASAHFSARARRKAEKAAGLR